MECTMSGGRFCNGGSRMMGMYFYSYCDKADLMRSYAALKYDSTRHGKPDWGDKIEYSSRDPTGLCKVKKWGKKEHHRNGGTPFSGYNGIKEEYLQPVHGKDQNSFKGVCFPNVNVEERARSEPLKPKTNIPLDANVVNFAHHLNHSNMREAAMIPVCPGGCAL